MNVVRTGEWVLDTDGAHFVEDARFDASAVADAGHGAPHGPRGAVEGSVDAEAYDQSPYVAPDGYVRLNDVPWTVRAPK